MEVLLEFIVEGIFEAVLKNSKAKRWHKTAVFILLFESLPTTMAIIMMVNMFRFGIEISTMVGFVLCALLALGILALGIYGHIKNWNLEDGRRSRYGQKT